MRSSITAGSIRSASSRVVVDGSRSLVHRCKPSAFGQPLLSGNRLTSSPQCVLLRRPATQGLPWRGHLLLRRALATKVPPSPDEQASSSKPKKVNINTDEMFGAAEAVNEHWIRMTINDDWERDPDGPQVSRPADIYFAKFLGKLDEQGMPIGRGKLYSQDNDEGVSFYYHGDFKNGKYHGKGRSVSIEHADLNKAQRALLPKNVYQWTGKEKLLPLGTVYEGDWEEGKMHGQGRLTESLKGDVYEGDFVQGRRTGKGKMISKNGHYLYVGEFDDGIYQGKGTLRSKDGDVFEGEFERGMMRHGKGKLTLEDGYIYEGGLYDGAPSGYGKQYHPDTVQKGGYEGNWVDGEYRGQGKLFLPEGGFIEGTFEGGMLEGEAIHTDTDGNRETIVLRRGVVQEEEGDEDEEDEEGEEEKGPTRSA